LNKQKQLGLVADTHREQKKRKYTKPPRTIKKKRIAHKGGQNEHGGGEKNKTCQQRQSRDLNRQNAWGGGEQPTPAKGKRNKGVTWANVWSTKEIEQSEHMWRKGRKKVCAECRRGKKRNAAAAW